MSREKSLMSDSVGARQAIGALTNFDARNARMQEFISNFSVPFTQPYNFADLMDRALFELRDFTATDRAVILEFQPDGSLLCTRENVISSETPQVLGRSLSYEAMKPILDEADRTGCFYEKEAARYFEKHPAANLGEKSFCYVPLTIGGNRAGYLVFFMMFEQANWAEGEFKLLSMAGSIIAGAYSRKKSDEALVMANIAELRKQEFISTFSVPFTQPYAFDELINQALFELRDFATTDRAIILEFQPDGSLLCTHESVINDKTPRMLWRSLSCEAMRPILDEADITGCFYEKEAPRYFEKHPATNLGEKSFCYIPLMVEGEHAGYLVLFTMFEQAAWAEGEFQLLTMAGSILAGAFSMRKSENALREATLIAQQANLAKSQFLSNMSHEIRTPMNSVVGFSELALDDDISQKTRGYLTKILENSKWLLHIINDILDISKIESGKMELEKIPFELCDIFSSCRTMNTSKAEEKGLNMQFYVEPSTGKIPLGDPIRLTQVLVNLLSNAIKFTNTGTVKMQSAVRKMTEKTITVFFEIKDSGVGMTPEQLRKIYEPFMQAESCTTRKYGGTGLGLAIAKSLVEAMGGKLMVESALGVGSTFSFELTFDAIDKNNDNTQSETKMAFIALNKPIFEGEVLLCEDNSMNQQVICEHLARVGLKAVVAENGKIGVEMVRNRMPKNKKQFDLVLMDMHMPVMDGLEAAKKIMEMNAGIPVVAMTANIMTNDREIYKTSGMSGYVGKPFTSQELWRCLLKFFKPLRWQTEDEGLREQADDELRQLLINSFMKNNRGKFAELTDAISARDIKLAHRLAHTLKSNAGQLGKTGLQKAAEAVEIRLKDGKDQTTPRMMQVFEAELNAAIAEFEPLVRESPQTDIVTEPLDVAAARKLLAELEPLLKKGDPECLSLTGGLRSIPESGEMIQKMEAFDFKGAMKMFAGLIKKYGGD